MDITKLVFEGFHKDLKLGCGIDSFEEEKWLLGKHYKNRRSVGCKLFYDKLVFDIGNDENGKIIYFILKFNNQTENLFVTIGGDIINLEKIGLEDFLITLNDNQIEWKFGTCWDKLIRVRINEIIEVVYAFYPDENGCQVVEISDREEMEKMMNTQFFD